MKALKPTLMAGIAGATMMGASQPANAQLAILGEVMPMASNFCPRGYADASGQLLAISTNQALFSLYGTIYGGDGRTTFALPDLRGRTPIGQGNAPGLGTFTQGSKGGSTSFTLTVNNLPSHSHTGTIGANPTAADTNQPVRNTFAQSTGTNAYLDGDPALNNMHPDTVRINPTGGGQSVAKVSPYQTIRWCVALQGIYPSRN